MQQSRKGRWLGVPYDWRRPTLRRVKHRWWNPRDLRLFTPKSYGWGYDLNLYWVRHPLRWVRARRAALHR